MSQPEISLGYRYYAYNLLSQIIISWLPKNLTALTIDGDTSDYVVSTATGEVLRVDPVSRAITTIAAGLGSVADIDFDPRTGGFAVATPTGVRLLNRAGATVRSYALTNAGAVRIDTELGHICAAGGGTITEFARGGAVLKTMRFPGYQFTSISAAPSPRSTSCRTTS